MKIDQPEFYFKVSLERIRQAKLLYEEGASYAFSMYAAGVAVESMLRALKMLRKTTFDEKHDLTKLLRASRMLDLDPELLRRKGLGDHEIQDHFREIQASFTRVYERWSNDFRFASEDRMRAYLKRKALDRGVRGDYLKDNARELLVSSQVLINKGIYQWNLLTR